MTKQIFNKRRLLVFFPILVILFLAISVSSVNAANYNGAYGMMYSKTTVYSDLKCTKKIGTVYAHEGVTILNFTNNQDGKVLKIEYSTSKGAKQGYIRQSGGNVGYLDNTCVAKVTKKSDLYYGNSTSKYQKSGTVYEGELVVILAKNGSWVYVEYNTKNGRKRGYMSYSNLVCYNRPSIFSDLYNYNNSGTKEYISGKYSVYSGPSEKYPVIGYVNNENVTWFSNYSDGSIEGAYIEYNVNGSTQKKSGFILGSY